MAFPIATCQPRKVFTACNHYFKCAVVYRFILIVLLVITYLACDTTPKKTELSRELSPLEKLAELSKAAVVLKVYSIVEADTTASSARPTLLPSASASIINLETNQVYQSHIVEDNLNVFLDVPAGNYRIHDLTYEDPRAFPVINIFLEKLDDRRIKLPVKKGDPQKDPLFLYVKSKKYQYGGDYSVVFSKFGTRTAPPDFENEVEDMKKGSELILAKYPHSRWAKEALKILDISAGDF